MATPAPALAPPAAAAAAPVPAPAAAPAAQGPQDPMRHFGRHFARTVDMFVLPAVVVQAGMEYDPLRPPHEYTPEERRNYQSWEALLRIVPNLTAMLADPGTQNPILAINASLLVGCNGARADDTRSIKIAIVEWLEDDLKAAGVVLHRMNKAQRGFNNSVTGRLLCPAVLDYDDPSVRALLESHQAVIDGEPVNGSDWPIFTFDERGYNPARSWETFLRGRLIVQAARHIFTSPSSAFADDNTEGTRGTRTGNAALHGMTKMTPGAIIYAATHVHFALSSVAVFNKNNKQNDTLVFHAALVSFFEDPMFAAPIADLLAWWTRVIFPTQHSAQLGVANRGLAQMQAAMLAAAAAPAANPGAPVQQ